MRIYKPRGVTKGQVVLVTILGFFGGIYIWKPLFEEQFPRKRKKVNSVETDIELSDTESALSNK